MKALPIAALAVVATQAASAAASQIPTKQELDELSLEELLDLRESILEAKQNLTYYIEESDDNDEDGDDDENELDKQDQQV